MEKGSMWEKFVKIKEEMDSENFYLKKVLFIIKVNGLMILWKGREKLLGK